MSAYRGFAAHRVATRSSCRNNSRDARPSKRGRLPRASHRTSQGTALRCDRVREATGDTSSWRSRRDISGPDVLKRMAYSEDVDMVCGTCTTRELVWEQPTWWFLRIATGGGQMRILMTGRRLRNVVTSADHRTLEQDPGRADGRASPSCRRGHLGLRKKLSIIEVPVNYRGRVGESKITGSLKGTLRTGFRMIGLIVRSRFA